VLLVQTVDEFHQSYKYKKKRLHEPTLNKQTKLLKLFEDFVTHRLDVNILYRWTSFLHLSIFQFADMPMENSSVKISFFSCWRVVMETRLQHFLMTVGNRDEQYILS
jgi:hypothetical protein